MTALRMGLSPGVDPNRILPTVFHRIAKGSLAREVGRLEQRIGGTGCWPAQRRHDRAAGPKILCR
jgi:hypothetical protein